MPVLSDRKIEIVKTLVEQAPDKIVGGLQRALAETGEESALAPVRQLVEAEAADRLLRNAIFLPLVPLCVGDGTAREKLTFPARALALVWRGLKAVAPDEVMSAQHAAEQLAAAIVAHQRQPDPTKLFDEVVAAAVGALREGEARDFRQAVELLDRARPDGAKVFAACLDICPVVRRAVPRLEEWVEKPPHEVTAAARLAFKDAVDIDPEGGPRFFEMVAAHLAPPWMVLRVICAVMDKPTERYLHDSELGGFAERVLDDVDAGLKLIAKLELDGGPEPARVAARRVGLITEQDFELEACMDLYRDHGWGRRILEQKKTLAGLVERILKDAEKLVGQALPTGSARLSKLRKHVPRFEGVVDKRTVGRAITALAFAQEVRPFAGHGGFSASHAKSMEKLSESLDTYVEEGVDIIRHGMADPAVAQPFLLAAADFVAFVRDPQAADLVRRRAVAAKPEEPEKQFVEI
jgi:hypothetical protein